MGNLGYKSEAQKSLFVCYNELDSYVDCLHEAMDTPYPEYEAMGQSIDGEYLATQHEPAATRERILQHHQTETRG